MGRPRLARVGLIPPCIDPLSPKNIDMSPDRCAAIMRWRAWSMALGTATGVRTPRRTPDRVVRSADILELAPVPPGAPIVTQVSRWDRLKDPVGVLLGLRRRGVEGRTSILAGPSPASVADDPEAEAVLTELRDTWLAQRMTRRERIHIANLPDRRRRRERR